MRFAEIAFDAWGYRTVETHPSEIVGRLVKEVQEGISNYDIVSIEFEDSTNRDGFRRAYADLPMSPELFDLFFNGRSEYRAQYFAGQEIGESYNSFAVAAIAPLVINNDKLYTSVDRQLCEKSLIGPYTKLWFPKDITSPDHEAQLLELPEAILATTWVETLVEQESASEGLAGAAAGKAGNTVEWFLYSSRWVADVGSKAQPIARDNHNRADLGRGEAPRRRADATPVCADPGLEVTNCGLGELS